MIYAKKIMSFFSDKIPCLCSPKASAPPPCPLNTTIFLFIYIISSLCLKQRKKMEQISEKKTSPSNREKKKKKVDVNEKKTEDTSSRHRLFSIYWAWKYDIKNFRILELCLPPNNGTLKCWNHATFQPRKGATS